MNSTTAIASGLLPTRNVGLLMELISRIAQRPDTNLPGMGVFYGFSGFGKSMAVCAAAIPYKAYYVQMRSLWSRKYLLEMILAQMNIQPGRNMSAMLTQIGKQLALSRRPLIIDEADILLDKGMIEVLRDIYESSQGTVVLVGEEALPSKLELVERVHGRVMDWVAAQPADIDDAQKFAALHCPGLTLGDDLLAEIVKVAHGSARYVCTNLARVAEFARMNNLTALNKAEFAGKLFLGKAPERRTK